MKFCILLDSNVSREFFYDIYFGRTITILTRTRTKLSGTVESLCSSVFCLRGSRVCIAAGPKAPWAATTASVCRAGGKPSTRFPAEGLIEFQKNCIFSNISYAKLLQKLFRSFHDPSGKIIEEFRNPSFLTYA